MAKSTFRHIMRRNPGRRPGFRLPVSTRMPTPLPRAALYHYWHPDREGVESCPRSFQEALNQVAGQRPDTPDSDAVIRCVRPAANAPIRCRCWLVWYRKPAVTHELSPGWLLLIAWHNQREPHPTPLPLDERLLANLYLQSARAFGSGKQYFDHIVQTLREDREREAARQETYRHERAHDYFQHTKIKNIGRGSKFALHHDGTLLPSRGEANWNKEREKHALPGEVLRERREGRK